MFSLVHPVAHCLSMLMRLCSASIRGMQRSCNGSRINDLLQAYAHALTDSARYPRNSACNAYVITLCMQRRQYMYTVHVGMQRVQSLINRHALLSFACAASNSSWSVRGCWETMKVTLYKGTGCMHTPTSVRNNCRYNRI